MPAALLLVLASIVLFLVGAPLWVALLPLAVLAACIVLGALVFAFVAIGAAVAGTKHFRD